MIFFRLEKNKKIKLGLKSKPKVRLKPNVFKLPIERVFADFEKPRSELSKHPFTVRVSKPNSFLKIKYNDLLCIDISALASFVSVMPLTIE